MLHQPFRHLDELLGGLETHSQAYSAFSTVPPSLADDIHRLEAAQRVDREDNEVNAFVAALNDLHNNYIYHKYTHTGTRPRRNRRVMAIA